MKQSSKSSKNKNSSNNKDSIHVFINENNASLIRNDSRCISCGACKSTCNETCNLLSTKIKEKDLCINCGQCLMVCPVDAIYEKSEFFDIDSLISQGKTIVFQTSPAVRASFGELFDFPIGTNVEKKLVGALRILKASYVFDTTFGADVTIMEEANELLNRKKQGLNLPQFTSCCPAWVKYVENFLPNYIPNLSTTKSPIIIQGNIIKTYFAKKKKINPNNIVNIAITPCTAKKAEIKRDDATINGLRSVDFALTTRELKELLDKKNIDLKTISDSNYDKDLSKSSGGALIFGNSGGVMESAVRYICKILLKSNPPKEILKLKKLRGLEGIKEATIKIGNIVLRIAVVNTTSNALKLLHKIEKENLHYDFIEVMACKGGCIAGGGQPKIQIPINEDTKLKRSEVLYKEDELNKYRICSNNLEIKKLYRIFLRKPLSKQSKKLLHNNAKKESYKV